MRCGGNTRNINNASTHLLRQRQHLDLRLGEGHRREPLPLPEVVNLPTQHRFPVQGAVAAAAAAASDAASAFAAAAAAPDPAADEGKLGDELGQVDHHGPLVAPEGLGLVDELRDAVQAVGVGEGPAEVGRGVLGGAVGRLGRVGGRHERQQSAAVAPRDRQVLDVHVGVGLGGGLGEGQQPLGEGGLVGDVEEALGAHKEDGEDEREHVGRAPVEHGRLVHVGREEAPVAGEVEHRLQGGRGGLAAAVADHDEVLVVRGAVRGEGLGGDGLQKVVPERGEGEVSSLAVVQGRA